MATSSNYYQILGLQDQRHARTLTVEEVKQAYRRALLQYHPDKRQSSSLTNVDKSTSSITTIDEITLAFKVLSDPALRVDYDRKISIDERQRPNSLTSRHTGIETVDLDDLDYDESTAQWTRGCRCGNEPAFVVVEAELEQNSEHGELIVGCKGCSLWLKVLFSGSDDVE